MTTHVAPDGRRFRTYEGRCLCSPCWQARCECGFKLTAHDFTEQEAVRGALDMLGRDDGSELDRPAFSHRQCPAGSRLDAC